MQIRKTALAGFIGLTTLMPIKAQKPVEYISETGITGVFNKQPLFYSGMNFIFPREKNCLDLFAGMGLNSDKQVSFFGLFMDNYNWTKNISSWAREVFVVSGSEAKSTLEVSPVRANVKAGKFKMSLFPAYTLYNNFKTGANRQGINTIVQTVYTISPTEDIFVEAKYTSEPAKNLFKTHFGKFKDNLSYMISYMKKF